MDSHSALCVCELRGGGVVGLQGARRPGETFALARTEMVVTRKGRDGDGGEK